MRVSANIHHPRVQRVDPLTSSSHASDFYLTLGDDDTYQGSVAMFFTTVEWEKFVSDVNEKRAKLKPMVTIMPKQDWEK